MPFKKGNQINKGRFVSNETRKKIGERAKGRKHSIETRMKMSKTRKGIKMPPFSEEHKKNIGESHKGRFAREKNPNWKGGISSRARIKLAPRPKPEQCEVCGSLGRICLDHDHKTGKFRGWICHRCNVALGMAKDNWELLEALADYIKESLK